MALHALQCPTGKHAYGYSAWSVDRQRLQLPTHVPQFLIEMYGFSLCK